MATVPKTLKMIESKIYDLQKINDDREFNEWRNDTVVMLENVYFKEDTALVNFRKINPYNPIQRKSALSEAKKQALNSLKNISETIMTFGIPRYNNSNVNDNKNDNHNTVNIHNNNSQEQSQKQSQEVTVLLQKIYESIDEELTGKQRNELKTIINSEVEPEVKKTKFIDTLKSFGNDVASNILANLLTNPAVYSGIANMF